MTTMAKNSQFTIGWISPLPLEKEAARLVLDEEYPQEEVKYQNTFYLGGRIGKHEVVIGVQRKMGLSQAAILAEKMHAGFPNIKYFLLVGIAGGVPRYGPAGAVSEIVLGDVVVSSPRSYHGGVLQYDKGAWEGQGRLNFRGHTNGVPGDLMAAINNFRAEGWSKTNIAEVLKQMRLKLDEKRRHQYDDPGPSRDRLFEDTYEHQGTEREDCKECCDTDRTISRSDRGHGANRLRDEPSVHFGNIASSNQLQISAIERNRIQQEHEAICFEMEAAGVMEESPCVVIRGICDYADSHKNKGWQNYAAATAAAYAKGLLSMIPATDAASRVESVESSLSATFYHGDKPDPLLRLDAAPQAAFNARGKDNDPDCYENTRVEVCQQIRTWAGEDDGRYIFWLNGWAGTGKSTIARTIAREYYDKGCLVASFFFSRGGGDVSHAGKFVDTLASQLAQRCAAFKALLAKAISDDEGISSKTLKDQWNGLIVQPLHKLDAGSFQAPLLIVVDALDECEKQNDLRQVLHLLSDFQRLRKLQCRVLITSRPEIDIRHRFHASPDHHREYVLHDDRSVDGDIFKYLQHRLTGIQQKHSLKESWPGKEAMRHLVRKAGGLFIWAATASRFIDDGGNHLAPDRLSGILEGDSADIEPEEELNKIYTKVLDSSVGRHLKQREKTMAYNTSRGALSSIVTLSSTLSACSLTQMLGMPEHNVGAVLGGLHSILDIPKDPTRPVRLHHPSLRDFLLSPQRCRDPNFWVDEKNAHEALANRCIQLMSQKLNKKDLCGLGDPGAKADEVLPDKIQHCLPPELQYACEYWVSHLQRSKAGVDESCVHRFLREYCVQCFQQRRGRLNDEGPVHTFFLNHWLHWFGALGLVWPTILFRRLQSGGQYFRHDTPVYMFSQHHRLHWFSALGLVWGMILFWWLQPSGQYFYHDTPVYTSFLHYWLPWLGALGIGWCLTWFWRVPTNEQCFDDGGPVHVFMQQHLLHWFEALSLLGKISDGVRAVQLLEDMLDASESPRLYAFVHDAKRFLVYNRTIIEEAPLQTYYCALAFAPQKSQVRMQFEREMVNWIKTCPQTVEWTTRVQTLAGHTGYVHAVVFSPDGKLIASASRDHTVRLWDAATGAAVQTLAGHTYYVKAVVFSPDGKLIASGSGDRTVRLWDTATGAVVQTLTGHTDYVGAVIFSPDSKLVASASGDHTVRLWDAATGATVQTLAGHTNSVDAVVFSPDGKLIASASYDCTVRLWDTATGAVVQTLTGHNSYIKAVVFSPDGKLVASVSADHIIRLWDTATGATVQTLAGYAHNARVIVFSPDSKLVASASDDHHDYTVRLWDTATGAVVQTLAGHTDYVGAVIFSPDSKLVASASSDCAVRWWDTVTGATVQTLAGYTNNACGIIFSPDGKLVASASDDMNNYDYTVRLWDAVPGAVIQTLAGHTDVVQAVVFSSDGKLVASASGDTIRLWDTVTSSVVQTLIDHTNITYAVVFSPDSKLIVSASGDYTIRLWDTATGVIVQTFIDYTDNICIFIFSPDSKLVALASIYTIQLWDTATGAIIQTLEGYIYGICIFSPDNKLIASASNHYTIQLWDTATGATVQMLTGNTSDVKAVVFSPDSKLVASASGDHTVRLWDTATGAAVRTFGKIITNTLTVSNDGIYVNTDQGFFRIDANLQMAQVGHKTFLRVKDNWITSGNKKLLWLPLEYRPSRSAVRDNVVVLGCRSGVVKIIEFPVS